MTSEKFGKVFLKRDGMHQVEASWRELPFTCFSNSDFIWYGADGEVHGQFKKFIGQPISLGFKITAEKVTGEYETFSGKLNTTYNLEEENVKTKESKRAFLMDNPTFERLTKVEHLDILSDYLIPVESLLPQHSGFRGEGKLLYYVLICVFCDSLKNRELAQKIKLPYQQISMAMKQYTNSIIGSSSGGPARISSLLGAAMINPAVIRSIKLSEMRVLQTSYDLLGQLATQIRQEAVAICGEDEKLIRPLVDSTLSTSRQGCLENCLEFRELSPSEQLVLAEEVIYGARGYQVILEAVALEVGVTVDDDIRESYLFKKCMHHFVVQMGKIQDIFSKRPSRSSLELSSKSFQEIMTTITQQANDNMKDFLIISNLLMKLYDNAENGKNNASISCYICLAKRIICGFIQWQTFRHSQLVFDCYVESNI